ncbi:MAG: ABC transporter permease [Bacteroidetes bacterium]|nr:ABC transporter permease [Bacteroidota bacterium]
MLKSYIITAIRNIKRQKLSSIINIFGLTLGIASFLVIFLYIKSELRYDKHWNDSDKIYRISESVDYGKRAADYALSPFPLAPSLQDYFPEVNMATRIRRSRDYTTIKYEDKIFNINNVQFADTNFFKIFNYDFIEGNQNVALNDPNNIVLSLETAKKFFGNESALGKVLKINDQPYTISGVINSHKYESHLEPNILRSTLMFPEDYRERLNGDWTLLGYYTYLKFNNEKSFQNFKSKLKDWHHETIQPWLEHHELTYIIDFKLEPLEEIHFLTQYDYDISSNADKKYLYIFGYVALFILLIVSINYINLATAKSSKRANEVGIRKIMGAQRKQLILQFNGEAIIISIMALIIACLITELFLPVFNNLTGKSLSLFKNASSLSNIGIALAVTVLIGIISGLFPALVLSKHEALSILGHNFFSKQGKTKSINYRKVLVIFQFMVTTAMIIATLVVFKQMRFMQKQNLGFDKDRLAIIEIPPGTELQQQLQVIQSEMEKIPNVIDAAISNDFPGFNHGRLTFYIDENGKYRQEMVNYYRVDDNFMNILDIKMQDGRFFSKDFPSDPESAFVINEAAKKVFGQNPIGQKLACGLGVDGQIVGITSNFNYASLHNSVEPLVFLYTPESARYLAIKIKGSDISGTLKSIEKTWKQFDSNHPYIYRFLDEQFNTQYQREEKMQTIFGYFSILIILLACLGLYGLSAFMAEQKKKEISIRKVMGSSSVLVVKNFVSQYLLWILIANAIAWPLAYVAMNKWLQNFAYRTNLSPYIFITAAFITLVLALGTISFHAFRAANTNPADVLRDE